jgi:aspartate/methionine/tyrosine aminotransferase
VREAISRYYLEMGYHVDAQQIFLTASTSEAYSYLMRLLVDPGQKVLFPIPSYPLFSFLGDINDVRMQTYSLVHERHWAIDFDGLEKKISADTKALVLVNPNNPTGTFVKPQEKEEINAICLEHNIAIVCDEVFFDFTFAEDQQRVSFVDNTSVLTFVLSGISKTLGLPQMKLSWIIVNGPQDLMEQAMARLEVIADTYLSVNTPAQNAFVGWIQYKRKLQNEIKERLRRNYSSLKTYTEMTENCLLLESEGGWYAVIQILDGLSDEQWVLKFLREEHVFVHPGYFFDFDFETYIVICLLPQEDVFQEGIRRIMNRLK